MDNISKQEKCSYSFRGNYSRAETIQGRKLFKGGNYSRKYGILILSWCFILILSEFCIDFIRILSKSYTGKIRTKWSKFWMKLRQSWKKLVLSTLCIPISSTFLKKWILSKFHQEFLAKTNFIHILFRLYTVCWG